MKKSKKILSVICMLLLLATLCFISVPGGVLAANTTYYVSSSSGNDNNNGTSSSTPWKTLAKASRTYGAGDKILLKCGDTWNEQLTLTGDGTSTNPVLLSSYGTGSKPKIQRTDKQNHICVQLNNPSGYQISGIEFDTGKWGIYATWTNDYNNDYIWIENCYFHNFDYGNLGSGYTAGIWFKPYCNDITKTVISNVTVTNCTFDHCYDGVDIFAYNGNNTLANSYTLYRNVEISYNNFSELKSSSIGLGEVTGGKVHHNYSYHNGMGDNVYGTCGGFAYYEKNVTWEYNEWSNFKRTGSGNPDGCGFDFEGGCTGVVFQNNYIHDGDGVAMMFLGNGGNNTNINVQNNTFSNNSLNPGAYSSCEITSSSSGHTGSIINNTFNIRSNETAFGGITSGFTITGNTINGGAGYKYVINKADNTYLYKTDDVYNQSYPSTRWLCTNSSGTTDSFKWQFVDAGGGYYYIVNKTSGLYLYKTDDVYNQSYPTTRWLCGNNAGTADNWKWQIVDAGGGYSYIVNKTSGLYLYKTDDVYNASYPVTRHICANSSGTGDNWKWQLVTTN